MSRSGGEGHPLILLLAVLLDREEVSLQIKTDASDKSLIPTFNGNEFVQRHSAQETLR